MNAEQFAVAVRRRVTSELAALIEVPYPSLAWSKGLEALVHIAGAPSSERRAHLCHTGYRAGQPTGPVPAEVVAFAAALELHHLFVLVVDDIMDLGTLRRGQPTLHRALRAAVGAADAQRLAGLLAGIVQVHAARLMAGADRDGRATERVLRAMSSAGVAQFRDVIGLGGGELAADRFVSFLADKGGDHSVAAPLVAGALLSGVGAEARGALERWAFSAGVAFQALDDLSDYLGSPLETGKDAFQDLVNRRPSTLTYLLAESLGTAACDELLRAPLTPSHRRRLAAVLDEHRVVERARAFVATHIAAARAVVGLPTAAADGLADVLDRLDAELRSTEHERPARAAATVHAPIA